MSVSRARVPYCKRQLAACLLLAWLVGANMILSGCGDGNGSDTKSRPSPASKLAPQTDRGAVSTTVPVYAGDPEATKKPKGEKILEDIPPSLRPREGSVSPRMRNSEGTTIAQWLNIVHNDVATFWQQRFNAVNSEYPPIRQVIFSLVTRDCNGEIVLLTAGAFYCYRPGPVTGKEAFFFSLPWMEANVDPYGDAAMAMAVAHEHGHRVQHLLGTIGPKDKYPSADIELQADCFAGLWMATKYQRGDLDPGDVKEGLDLAASLGDRPGLPASDPQAHGTSEQRKDAFDAGYNTGRGSSCKVADLRARRPK
jgi:predicted metalloprotease